MEDLLPIEIEAMKNNIEDCLDHARETRAEFDKVNKSISPSSILNIHKDEV